MDHLSMSPPTILRDHSITGHHCRPSSKRAGHPSRPLFRHPCFLYAAFQTQPPVRPACAAHCFPDIEQIVARVREVRVSLLLTMRLSRAYVLTNGRPEWLEELKDALQRTRGGRAWIVGANRDEPGLEHDEGATA
jgi:hypothetical protein